MEVNLYLGQARPAETRQRVDFGFVVHFDRIEKSLTWWVSIAVAKLPAEDGIFLNPPSDTFLSLGGGRFSISGLKMIGNAQDHMYGSMWKRWAPSHPLAEIGKEPAIKAPSPKFPDAQKAQAEQERKADEQGHQVQSRAHQTSLACAAIRIVGSHVPLCLPESQRQNPTSKAKFMLVNIAAKRTGVGNRTCDGKKTTTNEVR